MRRPPPLEAEAMGALSPLLGPPLVSGPAVLIAAFDKTVSLWRIGFLSLHGQIGEIWLTAFDA